MKITMRHAFYKALGRVLAPDQNSKDQLKAVFEVINELQELELSSKVERFLLLCRKRPWMYDVFDLIKERKMKDAYEQRKTKSVSRRQGYVDPAGEFFDLVKDHNGT